MHGYTQGMDAKLRASVLHRRMGVTLLTLGGVDSNPQPAPAGELQAWVEGKVSAPALRAIAGDELVLHIDFPTGSANFVVIETSLSIP